MKAFIILSSSRVEIPGFTYCSIISRVMAVSFPAFRIPAICSGVFMRILDIDLIYHITSRGLDPSAGPTIPSFSRISTTRAARPYPSFKCLWSIEVLHLPLERTSSIASSITFGSSSNPLFPLVSPQTAPSQFPRSHSMIE